MGHSTVVTGIMVTVAVTVVGGVACQGLARRLRVPAIVPLLIAGMLLGPSVLGVVRPEGLGPGLRVLVGFAVAIILFEGGLSLKMEAFRFAGRPIRNLVLYGALITGVLSALFADLLFPELGTGLAILFGALVIVTGPTVILPMLQAIQPRARVADTLRGEAILVDPVGALYAVLVLEFLLAAGTGGLGGAVGAFALRLGLGLLVGASGGLLLDQLMRHQTLLAPELKNLAVLAAALGLYAVSEYTMPESGVLTCTVAGFVLGWREPPGVHEVEEFKGHITVLMVSIVFILLAANVSLDAMWGLGLPGIALVAALILVVRPASVLLATIRTDLSWREKLFLSWIAPRGIVAAAVSSLFALVLDGQGIPGGEMMVTLTFAVIVGTVIVQGPTARMVARLLGVQELENTGFLIVGGNPVGRALASALEKLGLKVLVVDTNDWRVKQATEAGLRARRANPLDEISMEEVDLDGVGNLLAVTTNDQVNRLAVRLYARQFGREKVRAIKLRESPAYDETSEGIPYLFGQRLHWSELERMLTRGATIEAAEIDHELRSDDAESLPPGATCLMTVDAKGHVTFLAEDGPLAVGHTLLYVAPPDSVVPSS